MDSILHTLGDRFAALQAERVASWEPEKLRANAAQRERLVETMTTRQVIRAGDVIPDATLGQPDGTGISVQALLADGPVVLVFFRFAGCPACNIALPHYQQTLLPGLAAHGVQLVALSPQVPARVQEIAARHGLDFPVLTDTDNALARQLGIVFEPTGPEQAASLASGSFIGDTTGTGTWELPMPAIVLVDRAGIVRFADVSPDWLSRTESRPVLDAVEAVSAARSDKQAA